jgi:hypothetical protein
MSRNLPERIPKRHELHIPEHLKSISVKQGVRAFKQKYHNRKYIWLWVSLFIISIASVGIFFLAPHYQLISYGSVFGVIFLFTYKGVAKKRRRSGENSKKAGKEKPLNERLVRACALIVCFLTFFPLLFAVNSIAPINAPNYEFAVISQTDRLTPSQIDFSGLEYSPYLENLDDLSINDEFVIKCKISPFIGSSALVSVRFFPQDIPLIKVTTK